MYHVLDGSVGTTMIAKQPISKALFEILEFSEPSSTLARRFNLFMSLLIFLNVLAVVLETVTSVRTKFAVMFHAFEFFSITIFAIEYLSRVVTCTQSPKFRREKFGRIKYIFSPMALIDLAAIMPYFLPLLIPYDLRIIRALRLFRVLRILKLSRHHDSVRLLVDVLVRRKGELLTTTLSLFILLTLSSTLMYYIESGAQPNAFENIPKAMWWGTVTLTTVGYGDIYPITPLGKFVGSIVAFLGIGLFALPAGIIASGFAESLMSRKKTVCPHCNLEIKQ
jgi:voltage-gated potassium channel